MLLLIVCVMFASVEAGTRAACIEGVKGYSLDALGADAQKAAIKTACVRRDWLAWFYEKDKATYTSEVVRLQEALGLEEILAHTALKRCLHDFTKKEFSSENYEFVVAADAWKLIASDAVRAQRLCELQAQFFLDSSPKQINLPAKSFKPLKEVVCPVPAQIPVIATTFLDDARSIIFRLLEKDTFPRFRTSAIFADCRGSSKVDAEIRSFAAILDGFCQAQANAYSARDDAGKAKVLNLVKSDLGTECQKLQ